MLCFFAISFFISTYINTINSYTWYDDHYVQTTRLHCGKVSPKDRVNGGCIIPCDLPGSCSFAEANCHPFDSCVIECRGNDTCHHLLIDSRFGIDIECMGHNSCKEITYTAHDTYDMTKNKESKPSFNWDTFNFRLNNISINTSINIPFDKIHFGKNYIWVKGFHTSDVILRIKKAWHYCRQNGLRNQKRSFGNKINDAYNVTGHNMTYLNECFPDDIWMYFKELMKGMLKSKQMYTLNHIKNVSNTTEVRNVIDELWSARYDWQTLMEMSDMLQTRVIEYIRYNVVNNLGWHFDQESNLTMISLMSGEDDFEGGVVQYRDYNNDNENDDKLNIDNIENVRLRKGDVVMFPSIASHAVTQITKGVREVLVFEWWNIPRSYRIGRHGVGEQLFYVRQTNNPPRNHYNDL